MGRALLWAAALPRFVRDVPLSFEDIAGRSPVGIVTGLNLFGDQAAEIIPEPSTAALLGLGFVALAWCRRVRPVR